MGLVTMYDSVDVAQIPLKAEAVAGYVGGHWPTFSTLVSRFPNAHRLSIAVNASEDAECLDIENGDATVDQAASWFYRQKARGQKGICLYTSLSNVNDLVRTLLRAGIQRDEYRLWVAHYTGVAHLCGPSEGICTHADATQFTDKALGRNLDASLCDQTFFGLVSHPVATQWQPPDEERWCKEYDAVKLKSNPFAFVRKRVLKRVMFKRRGEIATLAAKSGWTTLNRVYRWQQLYLRTRDIHPR